jgi:hypothetical protein
LDGVVEFTASSLKYCLADMRQSRQNESKSSKCCQSRSKCVKIIQHARTSPKLHRSHPTCVKVSKTASKSSKMCLKPQKFIEIAANQSKLCRRQNHLKLVKISNRVLISCSHHELQTASSDVVVICPVRSAMVVHTYFQVQEYRAPISNSARFYFRGTSALALRQ